MKESSITDSINTFFNENNYEIIQCIYPGGQGGIYFLSNDKMIYPDIICFKEGIFCIGENKSEFSESDENKLLQLKIEKDLKNQSQAILDDYCFANYKDKIKINEIRMFLGFSRKSKKKSFKLDNFLVDENKCVEILKN